ncbi:MAG: hypothetical protein RQ732_10890 [Methylophaga sp.]|nr:hypothetical protein [Methylophaga sp.]
MTLDYFDSGLYFYCSEAKKRLNEIKDFHLITEMSWKTQEEKLQLQIEDDILSSTTNIRPYDISGSYGRDIYLNQTRYPNFHRSALVITLYSFLEHQLNILCEIISDSLDSNIRLQDISGKGVEKAWLFFAKIAFFESEKIPTYAFVKELAYLRNKIIHAGGVLPIKPNERLNNFVTKTKGLQGSPGNSVII